MHDLARVFFGRVRNLPQRGRNKSAQGRAERYSAQRRPGLSDHADPKPCKGGTWSVIMSQSLAKNLLHLVFSTKHRSLWIPDTVRQRLYAYQGGIFKEWDSPALAIGGVDDHVHVLFSLSKNHALIKIVEEVKKGSSKWMKREGTGNADFYWQNGYAAFSVSQSNVEAVKRYIENQEEHHRKMTFQDELRILLERHRVEFDERYVWD